MHRRTLLRVALIGGTTALAGCAGGQGTPTATEGDGGGGGGDGGDATPTDTEESMGTPTGTEESMGTPTDTEESMGTPTETEESTAMATETAQAAVTVTVGPGGSLRFDPETFTISTGETVRWVWDSGGHNVSPGSQPSGADWPGDDADLYSAGHTYAYTFEVAGDYEYHCDPHQSAGMVGSFTVE